MLGALLHKCTEAFWGFTSNHELGIFNGRLPVYIKTLIENLRDPWNLVCNYYSTIAFKLSLPQIRVKRCCSYSV